MNNIRVWHLVCESSVSINTKRVVLGSGESMVASWLKSFLSETPAAQSQDRFVPSFSQVRHESECAASKNLSVLAFCASSWGQLQEAASVRLFLWLQRTFWRHWKEPLLWGKPPLMTLISKNGWARPLALYNKSAGEGTHILDVESILRNYAYFHLFSKGLRERVQPVVISPIDTRERNTSLITIKRNDKQRRWRWLISKALPRCSLLWAGMVIFFSHGQRIWGFLCTDIR